MHLVTTREGGYCRSSRRTRSCRRRARGAPAPPCGERRTGPKNLHRGRRAELLETRGSSCFPRRTASGLPSPAGARVTLHVCSRPRTSSIHTVLLMLCLHPQDPAWCCRQRLPRQPHSRTATRGSSLLPPAGHPELFFKKCVLCCTHRFIGLYWTLIIISIL